jgi:hypothetical protein
MRHLILALLLAVPTGGPTAAADRDAAAPVPPAAGVRTGKERQGGKAFDEQRVDDCKVPEALRTRPRPTGCAPEPGR